MKKPSFETIKTITIILLVLSSMFLTYRLWFKDHNLFDIFETFQSGKKSSKSQNGMEYVYSPSKILLNLGENSHLLVRTTFEEYTPLQKEGIKIIKEAITSQKFEAINTVEWEDAMSSRSILIGYGTQMPSELFVKMFNISNSYILGNIQSICDLLIVQDSTVSDNIKVYIKDTEKGIIHATKFKYDDTTLSTLVSQIESKDLGNYVTGADIKTPNNFIKDDVLLLPTDAVVSAKQIKLSNEFNLTSSNDIKEIVSYFFDNSNIVRNVEYRDDAKSKIIQKEFVDRKRILKLYESGQIEYASAEIQDEKTEYDIYSSLKRAVDFIDSNFSFPKDSYLSGIKKIAPSNYVFYFDYIIEGLNVEQNVSNNLQHAIEIEVKGDIISNYARRVRSYTIGKDKELDVLNLKAIDNAIIQDRQLSGNKENERWINESSLVYVDDGALKEISPYWCIRINDRRYLINAISKEN